MNVIPSFKRQDSHVRTENGKALIIAIDIGKRIMKISASPIRRKELNARKIGKKDTIFAIHTFLRG